MSAIRVALTRIGVGIGLAMLCAGRALAQDGDLALANALNEQVVQLYRQGRYGDDVPIATEVRRSARGRSAPSTPIAMGFHVDE